MYHRKSQGGPTVDWSIIQPKLGQVKAEILLLFDCCFAAQAARAHPIQVIPANVELLAACAMGVKTRPPGPHSFTTHLIKQIRAFLKSKGSAKISDIVNVLAHRDSGCRETPVHFSGLGDGRSTVCLEPFDSNPFMDMRRSKEVAWLTLRVSLRDMLSEPLIDDIIRWLKARPSRKVSRLTIENVVQSANHFAHFIHDEGRARTSGPKYDDFSKMAKQDVLTAWDNFRSLLAALATQLRSLDAIEGSNVQDLDIGSDYADTSLRGPLATLLNLEKSLLSLQNVVQRSVMALPDLYEEKESLLEAIKDTAMQDLGFVPLLKTRLNARFPSASDTTMETDHRVKESPAQLNVFRNLVKEDFDDFGAVLIEYKTYDKNAISAGTMNTMLQNIRALADLLKTQGSSAIHSLQCISWFHDEQDLRFGLVFEYPKGYGSFKSLRDLIQMPASSPRPTLAQRFMIVKKIGEALLKWHMSANWVHQGVASHNIYFFKPKNSTSYDFSYPYLFGFEFARPSDGPSLNAVVENFEQNVYRHPSRQGAPSRYHKKTHDLYSYGILLFEVGVWNLVSNCFNPNLKENLNPRKMLDQIKYNAHKRLGHYMGDAYMRAASRCLNMEFGVELDDPVGSKLAKAFQDLVLEELEPGTRLD